MRLCRRDIRTNQKLQMAAGETIRTNAVMITEPVRWSSVKSPDSKPD